MSTRSLSRFAAVAATLAVTHVPLLGCGSDGSPRRAEPAASILLTDANNYAYTGSIHIPVFATSVGSGVRICWPELTEDMQCHALDAVSDIDNVSLLRFPALDHTQIEDRLTRDALDQADISGYAEARPGTGTCVSLSDMSVFGSSFDMTEEYTDGGDSYLLLLTTGTVPGKNVRMMAFLDPSADSSNTQVQLDPACSMLSFDARLRELEPARAPQNGPWTVDWSALTVNGLGQAATLDDIDTVQVGHYTEHTLEQIETRFIDLESLASSLWVIDNHAGASADLTIATGPQGTFDGVSTSGVWLLALRCSQCYNPAPVFLTVLEPPPHPTVER